MIQKKDLRIGNRVLGGKLHTGIGYDSYTISCLDENICLFNESNVGEFYKNLEAIDITEKSIRRLYAENGHKFEIDKDGVYYIDAWARPVSMAKFTLEWRIDLGVLLKSRFQEWRDDFTMGHIKFVHDLQNLFHSLTGLELFYAKGNIENIHSVQRNFERDGNAWTYVSNNEIVPDDINVRVTDFDQSGYGTFGFVVLLKEENKINESTTS